MQLFSIFNKNLIELFSIFAESFPKNKKITSFQDWLKSQQDANTESSTPHDNFVSEVDNATVEKIYKADPAILEGAFFQKTGLGEVFAQLDASETPLFWKNLQEISRLSSMIRACGEQLFSIEGIAKDVLMSEKYKESIKNKTLHKEIFQNLLSGEGDVASKLIDLIEHPTSFKAMLSNVKNILNPGCSGVAPPEEEGGGVSGTTSSVPDMETFGELGKLIDSALDGTDIDEMAKEMSTELRSRHKYLKTQESGEGSVEDGDSAQSEGDVSATGQAFDMMSSFIQNMTAGQNGNSSGESAGGGVQGGGGLGGIESLLSGLQSMNLSRGDGQDGGSPSEDILVKGSSGPKGEELGDNSASFFARYLRDTVDLVEAGKTAVAEEQEKTEEEGGTAGEAGEGGLSLVEEKDCEADTVPSGTNVGYEEDEQKTTEAAGMTALPPLERQVTEV